MPAMQWARPKSLSGLMLLGLALIAVPLLVAILTAALQIRSLADTGQKIVVEGVNAARASQDLFSQISSLERTARLYDVLNASNLLDVYRSQDARLTATREQLNQHATQEARITLGKVGDLQQTIRLRVLSMTAGSGTANMAALSRDFTEMSSLIDTVATQSNAQIDAEVAALEDQTLRARRRLLWQAALLVPLTIIAIFALTVAVGRPLRQLDRAIRLPSQVRMTSSAWAASSNGCANVFSISPMSGTASCDTCRMSSKHRSPTSGKVRSCSWTAPWVSSTPTSVRWPASCARMGSNCNA
jgi:two-component system sensor histidine kinase GlrK